MKTYLNATNRHDILKRALEHAFGEREKALTQKRLEHANDVYNDVYPADVQKQMRDLPRNYLPKGSCIMCRFDRDDMRIEFGDERKLVSYYHFNRSSYAKIYDPLHSLCVRHFEIKKEEEQLDTEKTRAKSGITAILESVRTVQKLYEVWPECEPFIKDYLSSTNAMLPALPIADINLMLGLTSTAGAPA